VTAAAISLSDPFGGVTDAEALILAAAALGWLGLVYRLLPDLRSRTGHGIVGLELAWSGPRARGIVATWRHRSADGAARRSLLTDLLLIALYVLFLVAVTVLLAHAGDANGVFGPDAAKDIVRWCTLAALVAGACDVLEDAGLLVQLCGGARRGVPQATTAFAVVKFALLGLLALFLVALAVGVALCCS
jgi:hypothetical protein